MEIITLREDYIKLGQALKAAALVEDGVEAYFSRTSSHVYQIFRTEELSEL